KIGFCPNSHLVARRQSIIVVMVTRGFQAPVQMPLPVPKLGKWKKPPQPVLSSPPIPARGTSPSRMISIIIPAHDEQMYLPATLEALRRQNYPWFEVIVVANGCTDQTPQMARGMCNRLIVMSQKSLGVARNLGARMAKGELLVFVDADTVLEPLALRVIAEQFSSAYAAGTIKGRPDCEAFAYRLTYAIKNFFHRSSLHCGSSGVI